MENHLTRHVVAKKKGDLKAAQVHIDRYNTALQDLADWSKEEEYLVPWGSVMRSTMDKVQTRLNTDLDVMSYNKAARKDINERLKENYE